MLPWAALCVWLLPPLSDLDRLPNAGLCRHLLEMNTAYLGHLRGRQAREPHHWDELEDAADEANYLRRSWEILQEAHYGCRHKLQQLRERIGDDLYSSGIMPSVVPMNRFKTID